MKVKRSRASKHSVSTFLPWIWRILCTLGNLIHIYHISRGYHEYPVSSEVNIEYPERQEVPSITFCFLTLQMFDWERVKKEKPDLFKMVVDDVDSHGPSNKSITERLITLHPLVRIGYISKYLSLLTEQETARLTLDSDSFLKDVRKFEDMFSYQTFRGDRAIRSSFTITVSLTALYKCFTIQDTLNGEPRSYSTIEINRAINRRGSLMIYVFQNQTLQSFNRIMVAFSLAPRIPRQGFEKFLTLSSISEKNIVSYDSVVNKLKSAPYGNCLVRNSQSKWHNQPHCMDSCVLKMAVNATRCIPPGITLTNDLSSPPHLKYLPFAEGDNAAFLRNITKQCAYICRAPDCESQILVPKKVSSVGTNGSTFYLFSNLTPTTHVTIVPQLTFSEYLVDLTSTFGFWTGLNVLQTLTFFIRLNGLRQLLSHLNGMRKRRPVLSLDR